MTNQSGDNNENDTSPPVQHLVLHNNDDHEHTENKNDDDHEHEHNEHVREHEHEHEHEYIVESTISRKQHQK